MDLNVGHGVYQSCMSVCSSPRKSALNSRRCFWDMWMPIWLQKTFNKNTDNQLHLYPSRVRILKCPISDLSTHHQWLPLRPAGLYCKHKRGDFLLFSISLLQIFIPQQCFLVLLILCQDHLQNRMLLSSTSKCHSIQRFLAEFCDWLPAISFFMPY